MYKLNKIFHVIKQSCEHTDCVDEQSCFAALTDKLQMDEEALRSKLMLLRTMKFIEYYRKEIKSYD